MFFQQLKERLQGITFNMSVTLKDDTMIVSVQTKSMKGKDDDDEDQNLIAPITVNGTAEELDEGFFNVLRAPLERAQGILVNTENFDASMEEEEKSNTKSSSKSSSKSTSKSPAKPAAKKKSSAAKNSKSKTAQKVQAKHKTAPPKPAPPAKAAPVKAAAPVKPAEKKPDPVDQRLAQVDALVEKKDFFKALDLCNAVLNKEPGNAPFKEKLDQVRLAKQRHEAFGEDESEEISIPAVAATPATAAPAEQDVKKPGKITPNPKVEVEEPIEDFSHVDTPMGEQQDSLGELEESEGTVEPLNDEF